MSTRRGFRTRAALPLGLCGGNLIHSKCAIRFLGERLEPSDLSGQSDVCWFLQCKLTTQAFVMTIWVWMTAFLAVKLGNLIWLQHILIFQWRSLVLFLMIFPSTYPSGRHLSATVEHDTPIKGARKYPSTS